MRKFTERLYDDMLLQIHQIEGTGVSGFDYYNSCYQTVYDTCKKLKEFILAYRFESMEDEIKFFKEIKPRFSSQLIYYIELIQVEIQKPPAAEKKELIKYYKKVSQNYSSSASRNQIFLHYIRTKQESGDHILFVRSSGDTDILQVDFLDLDDKFSTPASNELARIKSHEMVVKYLSKKMAVLKKSTSALNLPSHSLLWTESKVSLIELAYAIQSSGAINQGKASVAQIVEGLECLFNIELGKYYRVFQNIRIRQKNRTAFMDELRAKLIERMDESDMKG